MSDRLATAARIRLCFPLLTAGRLGHIFKNPFRIIFDPIQISLVLCRARVDRGNSVRQKNWAWLRVVMVLAVVFGRFIAPAIADERVALVIGNSEYKHTPRLINPRNDASDIALALKGLGFSVVQGTDLDKASMDQTIRRFAEKLDGANLGAFFYAGHGLQVGGVNYLVPIDAQLTTAHALDFEMVRLDVIQRVMENASNTNVIFLDACRDNPLARNLARALGTRSTNIGRGLAQVEAGVGTLISYATQPGNVALDGSGRNSPYTAALKTHIARAGEDLTSILIRVRNDVISATSRRQVPWDQSALRDRLFLSAAPPTTPKAGPSSSQFEVARFCEAVAPIQSVAILEALLETYKATPMAACVTARLNELRGGAEPKPIPSRQPAPEPPPPPPAPGADAPRDNAVKVESMREKLLALRKQQAANAISPDEFRRRLDEITKASRQAGEKSHSKPEPTHVAKGPEKWAGWTLAPQLGHLDILNTLAPARNGRLLLSGGYDGALKVWDTTNGHLLRHLPHRNTRIKVVIATRDGLSAVTGSENGEVVVWDVDRARRQRAWQGHNGAVTALTLFAGGKTLASAGQDKTVKLWDMETGQLVRTFSGGRVDKLRAQLDASWLVAVADGTVTRWQNAGASPRDFGSIGTHDRGLAVSPDGQWIIAGYTIGNNINIWDATSGKLVKKLSGHTDNWIEEVLVSGDRRRVAAAGRNGWNRRGADIAIWNTETGERTATIRTEITQAYALAGPDDLSWIAAAGWGGTTINIWNAETGAVIRTFPEARGAISAAAMSSDGRRALTAVDKELLVWDTGTGRVVRRLPLANLVYAPQAIASSPDDKTVAVISGFNSLRVYDSATGKLLREINVPSNGGGVPLAVAFDDRAVIARLRSGDYARWDLETGASLPSDEAANRRMEAGLEHRSFMLSGGILYLNATGGDIRMSLVALPGKNWVAIAADGLSYTGSAGAETYLLLTKASEIRSIDPEFSSTYARPSGLAQ